MPEDENLLLDRLVVKARSLLDHKTNEVDQIKIHEMKSLLYAAIERVGFGIERLITVQRLLRELLGVMNLRQGIRSHEREMGLQIINDLLDRYVFDFMIMCINKDKPDRAAMLKKTGFEHFSDA